MTKLDRAINNKVNLEQLKQFYESAHISAKDLFQILKNVLNIEILIIIMLINFKVRTTYCV